MKQWARYGWYLVGLVVLSDLVRFASSGDPLPFAAGAHAALDLLWTIFAFTVVGVAISSYLARKSDLH